MRRTGFAEVAVGGRKFVFDSREAVFYTSTQGITCEFPFDDRASTSNMMWQALTASKRIISTSNIRVSYSPADRWFARIYKLTSIVFRALTNRRTVR